MYSQLEGKYFLGRAGQPGVKAHMEATHHISKYLKVLNQTNKLLNKICSTLTKVLSKSSESQVRMKNSDQT